MTDCVHTFNKKVVLASGATLIGTVDCTDATVSNINHTDLLNKGTNTHAQIDSHIADSSIHFTKASIDHTGILNIGTNTHAQIDTHIATSNIHYLQTEIDHTNLLNKGTNTHSQIDSHIANTSNPHNTTIAQVSPLTTKGDLLAFSTVNERLPVGSDGQILVANSAASFGINWAAASSVGEINTMSNVGLTGQSIYKQKTGVNFEMLSIAAASNKITISLDTPNNALTIDVNSSNIGHSSISGLTTGDDHTQYILRTGRSGGQTLFGGTTSGNNLTLTANSAASNGSVIIGPTLSVGNLSLTALTLASTSTNGSISILPNGSGQVLLKADPTSALGAATKQYVDSIAQGMDVKNSCRVKTATLLPTYVKSGSASTATLTASVNGALPSIDGITLIVNNRILVDQLGTNTGADRGIYTVTSLGSVSTKWTLLRAIDANASSEVTSGLFTFIEQGTLYANAGFILTTENPITLDTTTLLFSQFTGAGQLTFGNVGTTGVGVYSSAVGNNIQFKNVTSLNSKLTFADNPTNKSIDITFVESEVVHQNLSGAGTNTHSQIDAHISNTSNPHSVTIAQVSPLTTKGDLLTFSSNNTRLPIGTNDQILTVDTATATGLKWASSVGESNTAANIGNAGIGLYDAKVGTVLNFRNIVAGSTQLSTVLDSINKLVIVDLIPGNISHQNLSGSGTNTHSQIDSHISNTSNPHNVTIAQVSPLTTKGDIIVYSTVNTRLPVGTNGQMLQADSTASTGMSWVTTSANNAFGTQYEDWEYFPVTVTASQTWQTILDVTTASKPVGRYLIMWSYMWNRSSTSSVDFNCRVQLDSANIYSHISRAVYSGGTSWSGSGSNQRYPASGRYIVNFASAQTHNLKLQFLSNSSSNYIDDPTNNGPGGNNATSTSAIWEVRIMMHRVA